MYKGNTNLLFENVFKARQSRDRKCILPRVERSGLNGKKFQHIRHSHEKLLNKPWDGINCFDSNRSIS